jgi:hypothetical protein
MLSKWKGSPLVGKRVRLEHTTDPYTELRSGDEGVVNFIDDAGTIFVKWDRGSGLGLIPGEDRFVVIS